MEKHRAYANRMRGFMERSKILADERNNSLDRNTGPIIKIRIDKSIASQQDQTRDTLPSSKTVFEA